MTEETGFLLETCLKIISSIWLEVKVNGTYKSILMENINISKPHSLKSVQAEGSDKATVCWGVNILYSRERNKETGEFGDRKIPNIGLG